MSLYAPCFPFASTNTEVQFDVISNNDQRKVQDQTLLAAIIESSGDAILSKTLQGFITSWNDAAAQMFGYTSEEIMGENAALLCPPDRLNEEEAILSSWGQEIPTDPFETLRLHKDGTLLPVSMTVSPIRDGEGHVDGVSMVARRIVGGEQDEDGIDARNLFRPDHIAIREQRNSLKPDAEDDAPQGDLRHRVHQSEIIVQTLPIGIFDAYEHLAEECAIIKEQRVELQLENVQLTEANRELTELAVTDGLTGLKNHREFQERLREEVERATRYNVPMSLLLLDVDKFKAHNDTYGHPAGDDVLRKIGEVLRATARTSDLVARYGGEEFAVILPETDAETAQATAERFRAAIEAAGWLERRITASIGVATLSPTVREPSDLIMEADKALYISKERGRNCVTHAASERAAQAPEQALTVALKTIKLMPQ